ncbi:hypothetical protein PC118_g20913, partial [Phytophthora cactorum]|jgi:hypothetical protein
MQE